MSHLYFMAPLFYCFILLGYISLTTAKPLYDVIPSNLVPPNLCIDTFKHHRPHVMGKSKSAFDTLWKRANDSTGSIFLLKTCSTTFSCKKEVNLMLKVPGTTLPIYSLTPEENFFVTGPYINEDDLPLPLIDPKIKNKLKDFKEIATMMARAIQQIQQAQIFHLDLTLSNWVLQNDQIRLIEFNNAKLKGDVQIHNGFEPNLPPELRNDKTSYTEKSDIWGLGMAYYNLWTFLNSPTYAPSFVSAVKQNAKKQDKGKDTGLAEKEYLQKNVIPFCSWFPNSLKKLIRSMVETDPRNRLNLEDILQLLESLDLPLFSSPRLNSIASTESLESSVSAVPPSIPPQLDATVDLKKEFDRKRYTKLPVGVTPAPLLIGVTEEEELDEGRGGKVLAARIQAAGVSGESEYVVKRCNAKFPCQKEITMLTLLRGQDVTPEIVAQNTEKWMYVMERLHGSPLRSIESIPKDMFLPIALRMAQILQKVHEHGILHLDLGFGNWYFDQNQNKVYLIDFGHARFIEDPSPYYGYVHSSAPETRQSQLALPSSDIWALGMGYYTLWTCTQKRLPVKTFQAAIKQISRDLSMDFNDVVKQYDSTSALPFAQYFPQNLKDLVSNITSHHPSNRPSLADIITKLSQLEL